MNHRCFIAAGLLCTTLVSGMPITAHAQEKEVEPKAETFWFVPGPTPIDIGVGLARVQATQTRLGSPFAPTPAEIRLSRGATTAIIVGAIIVGVLVLVGVVVLAKPGKHI